VVLEGTVAPYLTLSFLKHCFGRVRTHPLLVNAVPLMVALSWAT
jgi:hypothetical protein